jgi:orotate phosphoribosyltransferase
VADLIGRVPRRTGHFRFESGFHGDLWRELDALFADPAQTERDATALVDGLADFRIDIVCGAMTGGALLAQVVARHRGCLFAYTEREYAGGRARYWLAEGQHEVVRERRVALIDDVIQAGSATTGTRDAVVAAGGVPVAIGALLVLGTTIDNIAKGWDLPVVALERLPVNLWAAETCPLCASGMPLEELVH